MIRRTEGTFRSVGRTNLADQTYADVAQNNYAQRTMGATLLDPVNSLFPPTVENCKLIAFSVSAHLVIGNLIAAAPGPLFYGKLGRIVAGITTIGSGTQGPTGLPWTPNVIQFPNDLALTGDIWNPESDSLPPIFQFPGVPGMMGKQIGISQSLPAPIPIPQGTDLLIGLWMQPSLVSAGPTLGDPQPAVQLFVLDGIWSLVYDDGDKT